jgi:hypothetical protein
MEFFVDDGGKDGNGGKTTEERATYIRGNHGGDGTEVNNVEPRVRG